MELTVGVRIIIIASVVLISGVDNTPVHLIRSGLTKDKSEEDAGSFLHGRKQQGVTFGQAEDGFDVNSERKYTTAKDTGKYNLEDNDKIHRQEEGTFQDEDFHRKNADSIANIDKKIGHHKGHRKSGFHNTYHKEESGNNSSYYDDSIDDGDEYVHDSRKQTYDDLGAKRNYGAYNDGVHRIKENAKKGDYDHGGSLYRGDGNRKSFNQGKYNDERTDGGRTSSGYGYGLAGHLQQDEKYYRPAASTTKYYPPTYYQPPKRTITIYEDPRVLQPDYSDRFYKRSNYYSNTEPVNLDFRMRPLTNRNYYYDSRRPYYDYDYYYYN